MEISLKREPNRRSHAPGILTAAGKTFFTCEDVVREKEGVPVGEWKIYGKTAIPRGRYQVIINWSPRFRKFLPLLLDVPGFEGIRIHAGNTHENTEGCILPGMARVEVGVARSQEAMSILQPIIQEALERGDRVWITVE